MAEYQTMEQLREIDEESEVTVEEDTCCSESSTVLEDDGDDPEELNDSSFQKGFESGFNQINKLNQENQSFDNHLEYSGHIFQDSQRFFVTDDSLIEMKIEENIVTKITTPFDKVNRRATTATASFSDNEEARLYYSMKIQHFLTLGYGSIPPAHAIQGPQHYLENRSSFVHLTLDGSTITQIEGDIGTNGTNGTTTSVSFESDDIAEELFAEKVRSFMMIGYRKSPFVPEIFQVRKKKVLYRGPFPSGNLIYLEDDDENFSQTVMKGNRVNHRIGKVGTCGSVSTTTHTSEEEARSHFQQNVQSFLDDGYFPQTRNSLAKFGLNRAED